MGNLASGEKETLLNLFDFGLIMGGVFGQNTLQCASMHF